MTTQVTKVWWDGEKLMAEPIAESEIYKSQQEPVAISLNTGTKQGVKWLKNVEHGESLYTSPPQPQQEPVAWQKIECPICGDMAVATDIPPPQRTWVGLTKDERDQIWYTVGNADPHGDVDGWSGRDVMDAIEAKLKAKNEH